MITAQQIRAARHAMSLTFQDLSEACGVSVRTLKTIESEDGVPNARASTLVKIQEALQATGIEFITAPDGSPGIVMRRARDTG